MLLASCALFAQSPAGTFSLIPRVGATLSNITNETVVHSLGSQQVALDSKTRLGMMIGADLQYQLSELIAVSLGAFFQQAGCNYEDTDLAQAGPGQYEVLRDSRTTIQYLAAPLMAHLYVSPGFSLNLGVQAAFALSNRMYSNSTTVTVGKDGSYTYTGEADVIDAKNAFVNNVELSIPVGISYEKEHVVVDARYLFGLSKVYKGLLDHNNRNRVFIISAGYKFDIANL